MVDLSEYITHLEKLKTRNAKSLTEVEIREIVRELGWTEDDLAHLDSVIQTHLEKGEKFLERNLVDEAIVEFQEAHALAPYRPEVMLKLAQSHTIRWKNTKDTASRKLAEDLARRVIEVSPNDTPAYDILAALRTKNVPQNARIPIIAVSGAIVLLFLTGAVGYLVTSSSPDERNQPPMVSKTVLKPRAKGDITVPVELHVAGHNMRLEARRSINKNYTDSAFFEYGWLLHNESDHEFKSLEGTLELLDGNGTAVITKSLKVLGTHEALLRRGDIHTFNETLRSDPSVVAARLNLTTMDARPAPRVYPNATVVPLAWDVPKPSTAELVLRERESKADPGTGPLSFFQGTWELQNTGDFSFDALKLEIDLLDASGKPFSTHRTYITAPSVDFRMGESRVFATTHSLKGNFARYRIRVVEIQ